MSVAPAGVRVPEPGDFSDGPFSAELVDAAVEFIRERLAPHLTEAPTTDLERMASVLAFQADRAAMHTRGAMKAVGLGEAWLSWRTIAEMARMWSDHPAYQDDFGRTIPEFPTPAATHARVRVNLGECDCEDEIAIHRDTLVSVEDWDLPRWKTLREQGRLIASSLYQPLPHGDLAQVWYLISARRARRRRRPGQ